MPVNLQADFKAFDKELERLADLHPEIAGKTLRRQVVLLAVDIMERTPPGIGKGLTPAAREEGRRAVALDIRQVYTPASSISASAIAASNNYSAFTRWAEAVQKGQKSNAKLSAIFAAITGRSGVLEKMLLSRGQEDFDQFKRVLSKSAKAEGSVSIHNNFNRVFHQQAKGGKGRVPKGYKSNNYFVRRDGIASYREQVQARVGKLKAGWFVAIKALPDAKNHRKIPAWIKAAADESTGYSEDYSSAERMVASVAIANRIADKNGVSTRVSAISSAVQFRARMMRKEYDEALKDLAAKASRK
jgi:hypothetical protein